MPASRVTTTTLLLVAAVAVAGVQSAGAGCPALSPDTVDVDCRYFSKRVACNHTQLPGTTATFRCKPLFQVLYNFRPAAGNTSVCRQDGSWSIKPFKCYPVCGQPVGKGVPRVEGGKPVESAATFPWHVILYDKVKTNQPDQETPFAICGGSLVKPKFFVSAAHCFSAKNSRVMRLPSEYMAATGKMYKSISAKDTEPQLMNITKIHINDYGGASRNYANDIALVELEFEVEITATTMPICVDWRSSQRPLRTKDLCLLVGWGGKGRTPYSELRYAEMPYLEREECQRRVPVKLQVYTRMEDKFCVAAMNETNVAHGDSGGGLAVRAKGHNQWFLRGVVSVGADGSRYAFFTNVTIFVPWMASIIQQGEVSGRHCGVSDSKPKPGMPLNGEHGFPWDVEIYGVNGTGSTYTLLTQGVLVQPNLVVTVSWDKSTDALIGTARPSSLKVAVGRKGISTGIKDAGHVSKVRQVLYPDSLIRESFLYSVALLELQTRIDVMPACVDWEHNTVLQEEQPAGVTVGRTLEGNRTWIQMPLMNSTSCKLSTNFSYVNSYNLCANTTGTGGDIAIRYVMQEVDDVWFLRGVVGIESSNSAVVLTDLADSYVMGWMSKARTVVGKSECGQFALRSVPISDKPLILHMPWNVVVLVNSGEQTSSSGILIRNNVVLTSNARLVERETQSGGSDPAVDPENVTVAVRELDGTTRMVAVEMVHVHEEDYGSKWEAGWDTVLLKLKEPLKQMPACLDLTGSALTALRNSQRGLVETWSAVGTGSEALQSAPYLDRSECHDMLKQTGIFPTDVHCVGPFSNKLWSGSGFFTRAADGWYVRGVSAFHWDSQDQLYAFTSLAHPNMLHWLQETLQSIPMAREQAQSEAEDSSAWLERVVVPKQEEVEALQRRTSTASPTTATGSTTAAAASPAASSSEATSSAAASPEAAATEATATEATATEAAAATEAASPEAAATEAASPEAASPAGSLSSVGSPASPGASAAAAASPDGRPGAAQEEYQSSAVVVAVCSVVGLCALVAVVVLLTRFLAPRCWGRGNQEQHALDNRGFSP